MVFDSAPCIVSAEMGHAVWDSMGIRFVARKGTLPLLTCRLANEDLTLLTLYGDKLHVVFKTAERRVFCFVHGKTFEQVHRMVVLGSVLMLPLIIYSER